MKNKKTIQKFANELNREMFDSKLSYGIEIVSSEKMSIDYGTVKDGMCEANEKEIKIIINSDTNMKLLRFVICHELTHVAFRRGLSGFRAIKTFIEAVMPNVEELSNYVDILGDAGLKEFKNNFYSCIDWLDKENIQTMNSVPFDMPESILLAAEEAICNLVSLEVETSKAIASSILQ